MKELCTKNSRSNIQHATDTEELLRKELKHLKIILNVNNKLTLKYRPDKNAKLAGEVKGSLLYVYDSDQETALATLRHEILDYAISKAIEPYRKIVNKLIEILNEEAYERKEILIETLVSAIQLLSSVSETK
jgi:hypothetical protein